MHAARKPPRTPATFANHIDGTSVDLSKCGECAHHQATAVFDLCKHAQSLYSIAGKADHHTIGHMRTVGACRAEASLFSPVAFEKTRR